jgi:hypothetical protein
VAPRFLENLLTPVYNHNFACCIWLYIVSLTPKEEHGPRVSENGVVRRSFGARK